MGWFQKLQRLADTSDPMVSWGERIFKVLLWVLGGPMVSGLVFGAVAWVSQNLLYGVLIGLAGWAMTQVGFTVWGIRRLVITAPQPHLTPPEAPDVGRITAERDEARGERDELREEIEHLKDWSGQEQELKLRALRLSPELFRFAQERDNKAPPEATLQISSGLWDAIKEGIADPKTQERTNFDNETRRQYSELYGGDVVAVLDAIEECGWLDASERKSLEEQVGNEFMSPTTSIRQIAQRLAAIGKRIDENLNLPNDEEVLAENERLRTENDKLQEQLNRFDGDRLMFRDLLQDLRRDGFNLRERNPSKEDARNWGNRVSDLLEAAIGDWVAEHTIKDEPPYASADLDATTEQAWIDGHLQQLHDLIQRVEGVEAIPFRSDFDPHNWRSRQ